MTLLLLESPGGIPGVKLRHGTQTSYPFQANGGLVGKGAIDFSAASSVALPAVGTGAQVITAASANALTVGRVGTTNPTFNVDTSTASVATGINIKGAAAGGGIALAAISSGSNENLTVDAKGTGTLFLQSVATGSVSINTRLTIAGSSATALSVGANGATNPAFNIDASTASSATGLNVKSAAAGGGLALSVLSSGAAENLTINAKGTGLLTLQSAVGVFAGGAAVSSILVSSNTGFGVYWGSGAPTVSAAQGSLYIRSDGSSTSTRLYVNTNGSTTWTNVTTAA